jgi:SAM-dependent methyltransferase
MELKQQVVGAVVRQFGHPRGAAGRVAGWTMGHRSSNVRRNVWAAEVLDVAPGHRVLEIGFGPGVAIEAMAARVGDGRVYGIDQSEVMVRQASRRNRAAIVSGQVELAMGSVDVLADFGEPLDRILAVNSIGFWPDPVARLSELRALLRPGGVLCLVAQPRTPRADAEASASAADELRGLLSGAGFGVLTSETLDLDPPAIAVLATPPVS